MSQLQCFYAFPNAHLIQIDPTDKSQIKKSRAIKLTGGSNKAAMHLQVSLGDACLDLIKLCPVNMSALSDQRNHLPYILHGVYYLKDRRAGQQCLPYLVANRYQQWFQHTPTTYACCE